MAGSKHAVFYFKTADWGTNGAAYEAAKKLFNRLRSDNDLAIVDRLSRLSAKYGHDDGWFVRTPSPESGITVVNRFTDYVSVPSRLGSPRGYGPKS